ncbi:MAG TPA: DUF4266 domain-containing protein [Casimicrobiaceae bacterium]|nr:DUF4266 domain-containing protein [Casimicrobiaceae bacterium]
MPRVAVRGILARRLVVFLLASSLAACATYAPPQAWEKGDLAKPAMQFDPDPLAAKLEQHVYTSKEATTGGYGVGGGGCGCN